MTQQGLYQKYVVTKADSGEVVDGPVFVLRPDRDPAAMAALITYARHSSVAGELQRDLQLWTQALRLAAAGKAGPQRDYKVGMGTGTAVISAPSPMAAALYYGLNMVRTNNPFMAVLYSVDGETGEFDMPWVSVNPDETHVKMVAAVIREQLDQCSLVEERDE